MVTACDYAELAKQAANNHAKFDSFAWHDEVDDSDNWTIIYTCNRDSGPLERANAQVIAKELEKYDDDVRAEHHGHWAVGWVDGFAIRVYDDSGEITAAFRTYCDLQAQLDDYPVLDDELLSQLEQEEIDESWECWIASDFTRAVERKFDIDCIDWTGDQSRAMFDKACNESSTYPEHTGNEVIVDIAAIVDAIDYDDVRQFAPQVPVRIYRDGNLHCAGYIQLDEYSCDQGLYEPEFAACIEASDNGDESVCIDGAVYTWEIG